MYPATKAYALSLAITVLSFLSPAEADPIATCQSGWEWSYNSKGQNSCQIAGSLQTSCVGTGIFVLLPLAEGTIYVPPAADDEQAQKCSCNTIIYSLYMSCVACQNRTVDPWSRWEKSCGSVRVTEYPFDIPRDTAVPHWAYLNYTEGGWFDPILAKAAGRDPEAIPKVPSTVSLPSSTTPITQTTRTIQTTPTPTTPASSSILSTPSITEHAGSGVEGGSKVNVGTIVGVAIGGAIVLVAFAVLTFVLLKRRRGWRDRLGVVGSNQEETKLSMQEFEQQKLYDPSDPSTYPTVRVEDNPSWDHTPTTPHWPGRYNGAAEL